MDSQILKEHEKIDLRQLFIDHNYDLTPKWKLIYRGSQENFSADTWNAKCGQQQNIICIIESDREMYLEDLHFVDGKRQSSLKLHIPRITRHSYFCYDLWREIKQNYFQ